MIRNAANHEQEGFDAFADVIPAAKKRGMKAETVDLRNSGDTAGPRDQVVGYGAYVFQ